MKTAHLTKITLLILSIFQVYAVNAQCNCDRTISSAQSGSLELRNNETVCITASGSFTGEISLKNNSILCNMGTINATNINFSNSGTIENSGEITISKNLDLKGTLNNSGSFTSEGTFVNKGVIANSGTFKNTGSFDNNSSGSASISNTGSFSVVGNFTNQNDFTNDSTAAVLNVTGYFKNSSSGSTSLSNSGSIAIGSYFENNNELTNAGSIIIDGSFTNSSSGSTTVDNSGTMKVRGDFTNSNDVNNTGTFTIQGDFSQSNTGSAEVNNNGTFYFEGNVTSDNDIYNNGSMAIGGTYTNKKWSGTFHAEANSLLVVDSLVNESNITSASNTYGQIQVQSYSENSGNVATYIDVCILSNNGNWNSNTGTVNTNVTSCSTQVATPSVSLNVKVFLEACYDATNHNMKSLLRGNKVLPKQQPFSGSPWNYSGTDEVDDPVADISTSIVDWVLVSFRTTTDASSTFFEKTFFINNDGKLTNANGSPATLTPPSESSFYIVVEARNHLSIISSSKVSVVGGAISYDFTTAQSKAQTTGTPPMVEVESGVYAMYSGDINGDGTINAKDAMLWKVNDGTTGYTGADVNLDNQVDSSDKSIWQNRNGFSIQFNR
ncbi:hypothetical protein GC194_10350 [bacterium]|nr:hypothetical protein [bacterium]